MSHRDIKPVENKTSQIDDNLCPSGSAREVVVPLSSSHLLDMSCKVNGMILKHFFIMIKKHTFFFFSCLRAVSYLTSTHNEQCKTSRNLITRRRQGPSKDRKWLTQLIKHPTVRLNVASPSHQLQYGLHPFHIFIFPFHFLHVECTVYSIWKFWPLIFLLLLEKNIASQ